MAKARHDEPQSSSKATMAVLIVGGLLVAALVVWALTRTVEPESTTATSTFAPVAGDAPIPTATGQLAASDTSVSIPPAAPQPQGNRTDVKRISAEDLRSQVGRGEVTVIDVRTAADYARGHIPGAINVPFASVETQFDTIPKDKPIVTYCT
jgi:hypothetical protein